MPWDRGASPHPRDRSKLLLKGRSPWRPGNDRQSGVGRARRGRGILWERPGVRGRPCRTGRRPAPEIQEEDEKGACHETEHAGQDDVAGCLRCNRCQGHQGGGHEDDVRFRQTGRLGGVCQEVPGEIIWKLATFLNLPLVRLVFPRCSLVPSKNLCKPCYSPHRLQPLQIAE